MAALGLHGLQRDAESVQKRKRFLEICFSFYLLRQVFMNTYETLRLCQLGFQKRFKNLG